MLSQLDRHKHIVWVILLRKVVSCLLTMCQHCTGKTCAECCPGGSRQHCRGKNPAQCCLNTLDNNMAAKKSC